MKKNRLGIIQIIAAAAASIMLIAGAASGVSAAELENDIMNQDYRFANNVARVDDNGGAIY